MTREEIPYAELLAQVEQRIDALLEEAKAAPLYEKGSGQWMAQTTYIRQLGGKAQGAAWELVPVHIREKIDLLGKYHRWHLFRDAASEIREETKKEV